MNNQTIEIIDSSQMTVLSQFDYLEEVFNNTDHYTIGVVNENVLIRTRGLDARESATFLYERANHSQLMAKIEDVFAGKVPESNKDYFEVKSGKDFLVIGIVSTFPMAAFKPIIKFDLTNNRRAKLDESESGNWFLPMSTETAKLMLAEVKRIENQVVNLSK